MFEATRGRDRFTDTGLFGRVEEALEALPSVSSVATSRLPVLSLEASVNPPPFTVEGLDAAALSAFPSSVSADFFQTFDVELLAIE